MSCPHTCEWPLLLLGQECRSQQDLARQKKENTATCCVQLLLAFTGSWLLNAALCVPCCCVPEGRLTWSSM